MLDRKNILNSNKKKSEINVNCNKRCPRFLL